MLVDVSAHDEVHNFNGIVTIFYILFFKELSLCRVNIGGQAGKLGVGKIYLQYNCNRVSSTLVQ